MARLSLKSALAHPLTRELHLDCSQTTELRLEIIRTKVFLRRIYDDWYRMIRKLIPAGAGRVLELGSGAGYLHAFVPDVIRSEVFVCRNAELVADARSLPFTAGSLKSIVMTDVFHHIPDVRVFLREAVRCLRPGGRVVMVEPWVSQWSKLVYRHLHHEPFLPAAERWELPSGGPLSGANVALPWIVLARDRARFEMEFPELQVEEIRPMMPLSYLVCGGISMRSLMPGVTYGFWRWIEYVLSPWRNQVGMFALISLRRV